MRRALPLVFAVLPYAVLLSAGCRQAPERVPTAVVPTSVAPTAPQNVAGPSAAAAGTGVSGVPAPIDLAYLEEVFSALDALNGELLREVVERRVVSEHAYELLTALYTAQAWQDQVAGFDELLDAHLDELRADPGNRRTAVLEILDARPGCVVARVVRDFSAVVRQPPSPTPDVVALRAKIAADDPAGRNPTPWQIAWDRLSAEGNPCAA